MLAISAEELENAAPIGVKAACPKCGKMCPVITETATTYTGRKKVKGKTEFAFVDCCGKSWLVGIDGVKI